MGLCSFWHTSSMKNLDRLTYHNCPQSVSLTIPEWKNLRLIITAEWGLFYPKITFSPQKHSMFHYIMNTKIYFWVLLEIIVGSLYKPTCPGPYKLNVVIRAWRIHGSLGFMGIYFHPWIDPPSVSWGLMNRTRILFMDRAGILWIPRNPPMDSWMKINSHESPWPTNPSYPE